MAKTRLRQNELGNCSTETCSRLKSSWRQNQRRPLVFKPAGVQTHLCSNALGSNRSAQTRWCSNPLVFKPAGVQTRWCSNPLVLKPAGVQTRWCSNRSPPARLAFFLRRGVEDLHLTLKTQGCLLPGYPLQAHILGVALMEQKLPLMDLWLSFSWC
jgi:hypothetical protein